MRKRLSILVILVLSVALSCHAQNVQQPAAPSAAQVINVAGTTWAGTGSDGRYIEYYFQVDGSLHYRSPTGFWKNGTWKQHKSAIYMETNNRFSERLGMITGTQMEGQAWNSRDEKWTWKAEKK
jgi:hypothetical protein